MITIWNGNSAINTEKEALALFCDLNDECFFLIRYEPDSKMLSIFCRCTDHIAPDEFCRWRQTAPLLSGDDDVAIQRLAFDRAIDDRTFSC